mgnify:CR=1 FL=1
MKTRMLTPVHLEPTTAWQRLTQQDRRRMTVPQLIEAMGPLHVHHPDYKPHGRVPLPQVPLRNLVKDPYPEYSIPDIHSFWGLIAAVAKMVLR